MGQESSLPTHPLEKEFKLYGNHQEHPELDFFPPDHPIKLLVIRDYPIHHFPLTLKHIEEISLVKCNLNVQIEKLRSLNFKYPKLESLNIMNAHLSELPMSIQSINTVKKLSLSQNLFENIDFTFSKLTNLDLSMNLFREIPVIPQTVTILDISFNKITKFEVELPYVEKLNLSGNELIEVSSKCKLKSLKILNLSYNRIIEVASLQDICPKLKKINLAYNYIEEFPDFPDTVEHIKIMSNNISSFPRDISNLKNLRKLKMEENKLVLMPKLPPNVEIMLFQKNSINQIEKFSVKQARILRLDNNNLNETPNLKKFPLKTLRMRYNHLKKTGYQSLNKQLKNLDYTYNMIREIENGLFSLLGKLNTLNISHNSISKLPTQISKSKLKILNISENPISELPSLPTTLLEIVACKCKFTELPSHLSKLPKLERVNFSVNEISSVEFIPNVKRLNLASNNIETIPELPQDIEILDLSFNNLSGLSIPQNIKFLDVSHNHITVLDLPKPMKFLSFLQCSHNPIEFYFDFNDYPMLDHADISSTKITHQVPVPRTLDEFVISDPIIYKKTQNTVTKLFTAENAGYSESIGNRENMEDSLILRKPISDEYPAIYGVLDGHGGPKTARIAAMLIPKMFYKLDKEENNIFAFTKIIASINEQLAKARIKDGSAMVVAIIKDQDLGIAHLGDARALLIHEDHTVFPLTYDHKPYDRTELDQIRVNGASVIKQRINGSINLSRTLGDFKVDGVNRVPELKEFSLSPQDSKLILACDGVFDVISNEEMGELIKDVEDCSQAANIIKNVALARNTMDNVSVMVIDLKKPA